MGALKAFNASRVHCREMDGKAAVKSYSGRIGSARSKAKICESWSVSTTLASMELLGRSPLWWGFMSGPANFSHRHRQAPGKILLSGLEIATGLVFSPGNACWPSGVVLVGFLGRQAGVA